MQTAPASPLRGYAELLQRDLGTPSGSAPPQQPQFNIAASCPAPSGQCVPNQGPGFGLMATAQHSMPITQPQSTGMLLQTASKAATGISTAEGATYTNPLMSMPGR